MANLSFTASTIRGGLKKVANVPGGFKGCCPCHDDSTPSLDVTVTHTHILIICRGGCSTQSVIDRLGLDWPDLFADGVDSTSYRRREPGRTTPPRKPHAKAKEKAPPDYTPLLQAARQLPQHRQQLLALADHLGAAPASRNAYADAAEAIGVVWLSKADSLRPHLPHKGSGWAPCWGVPERDADGVVIGVARRFPDGTKKQMAGGKRGLTYAISNLAGDGPILCPEGASDVVALIAAGLVAIGRPSNTGGAKMLSELLCYSPSSVIVLGENDQKPDGRCPGREGMEKVAAQLASSLPTHVVRMAMPPRSSIDGQPAKDARAWFGGVAGAVAGAAFLAALTLVQCPHVPLEENKEEERRDATPDLLAGLHVCPRRIECRRGKYKRLNHKADPRLGGFWWQACGAWGCPVCRLRNSHEWATHLAACMEDAVRERNDEDAGNGKPLCSTLYAAEMTRHDFDKKAAKAIQRRKVAYVDGQGIDRKQKSEWHTLEQSPGRLLVIAAIPEGASSRSPTTRSSGPRTTRRSLARMPEMLSGFPS